MHIPIIKTAILLTAIFVSLDAIFVGMSLKLQKGFKMPYIFLISGILLTVSVAAYYTAGALTGFIGFDASWIIGGAFLLLGIRNLFAKDEDKMILTTSAVIVISLVMSIDCVVATVALVLEQGQTILIPVLIVFGHFVFLVAGSYAVKFIKLPRKLRNVISASCLFLVAILNFAGII